MKERDKVLQQKKKLLKEVLKKKLKDLQVKPGKETVSQPVSRVPASWIGRSRSHSSECVLFSYLNEK